MSRSAAELSVGEVGTGRSRPGCRRSQPATLEMGVTPGVEIRRLGAAPLGDPLEFELRGYRLSLRKAEAAHVELDTNSQ